MSYQSCQPYARCYDKKLELIEIRERPGYCTDGGAILGSTIFYPITVAITIIRQLYLTLDLAKQKYKIWRTEHKIQKLDHLSQEQLDQLIHQRGEKLKERERKLSRPWIKALQNLEYDYTVHCQNKRGPRKEWAPGGKMRSFAEIYSELEIFANKCDSPGWRWVMLDFYEKEIELIKARESAGQERSAYESIYDQEDKDQVSTDIKKLLRQRYKFSIIRHKIDEQMDKYCLYKSLRALIPVIGLFWYLRFPSQKDHLEATPLVGEYNERIKAYGWFKAYKATDPRKFYYSAEKPHILNQA